MRILLVAYDFPPVQSPRALRWHYLTRELVRQGHDVHIMMPDPGGPGPQFEHDSGSLCIHRSFPGLLGWLMARSRRHTADADADAASHPLQSSRLNWRGRLVARLKKTLGCVLYPDIRAEWSPWARRQLARLLREQAPDVVITSHEPATTLPLGRRAQRAGFRWVADLGDPVCAHYTPRHWRRRAHKQEAMVCHRADALVVTTDATREQLAVRHQLPAARCVVIPNGWDDRRQSLQESRAPLDFDPARLELIQAGRVYAYRDPIGLIDAVAACAGVRLTLIVPDPPQADIAASVERAGDRVRVVGALPHAAVLDALERADILVNFGNAGPSVQIPARLFEYLGIERPILHVVTDPAGTDVAARMLEPLQRGWICVNNRENLAGNLTELRRRKQQARLYEGMTLAPVAEYAHSVLGQRWARLLKRVAETG